MDPLTHAAELGGHFRTEFEALAVQFHSLQQGTAKNFVASSLVVDSGAIQKIGEMSEQFRAEKKTQSTLGPVRAHSVHNVGTSFAQGAEQRGIVARVVLEIRILD